MALTADQIRKCLKFILRLAVVLTGWQLYALRLDYISPTADHLMVCKRGNVYMTTIYALLILHLQFLICYSALKLDSASIIYRHGDRSPLWLYPTDKHKSFWKFGLGSLTNEGIMQEFNLGQYLRQYYVEQKEFLSPSYFSTEVVVKSTDIDRTLMSAQSLLTGLFPPNASTAQEQVWNSHLNWQPIPIHTEPIELDYLLCAGGACPLFKIMEKQLWETDSETIEINKKYRELFHHVKQKTGLNSFTLANLHILVDPLICEHSHNLSLPEWLNTTIVGILFDLHNLRFKINYKYDKMQTLGAGTLITELTNIMLTKVKENEGENVSDPTLAYLNPKLHMYSAHDTTLTALLSILQAFQTNPSIRIPNYASAILIELYSRPKNFTDNISKREVLDNNLFENRFFGDDLGKFLMLPKAEPKRDYFVKVLYRNSPLDATQPGVPIDSTITPIKMPGCLDEYCPLENFVALVKNKFPTNIEKQCRDVFLQTYCQRGRGYWAACFVVFPLFLISSVILIAWVFIVWSIKRKVGTRHNPSSEVPYMPIPSTDPTPSQPLIS